MMGDTQSTFLFQPQQKLCLKIVFGLFSMFTNARDQTKLLSRLLLEDPNIYRDDMAMSVFIGSFVKPLMSLSADKQAYLEFVLEYLFPRSLDVLYD
jgi:hypothetical protein